MLDKVELLRVEWERTQSQYKSKIYIWQ